jgi:inner membrane transporter RhtA
VPLRGRPYIPSTFVEIRNSKIDSLPKPYIIWNASSTGDPLSDRFSNFAFLAPAAVLGSIVSLTVGTSYGKQLFPLLGAQGTATFRVVFAAIILLLVWRPWRLALSRQDAKGVAIFGATLGLMNLMFYLSLETLPIGIAIAIEFTGPLTVALASSRRLIDFVWVAVAAVGLLLLLPITSDAPHLNPTGIAFAIASAILWALYIIFGKRVGHLHAGQSTSLGMLVAALIVLPAGIARAGSNLLDPTLLISGLALAIFSSAIPYTLEMFALKRMQKNTFGILLSMEPAVGALAGLFILKENLTLLQWLAVACVMAASIGSSMGAKAGASESIAADLPEDTL